MKNHWKPLSKVYRSQKDKYRKIIMARCVCGLEKEIAYLDFIKDRTTNCGCLRVGRKTHGMKGSRIYKIWTGIKQRCLNEQNPGWKNYGGRGISIFEEWKNSFESFYRYVGNPPNNKSLDRINNNGNYEPGNVRWCDQKDQTSNMRKNIYFKYKNKKLTLPQIARMENIPWDCLYRRARILKIEINEAVKQTKNRIKKPRLKDKGPSNH